MKQDYTYTSEELCRKIERALTDKDALPWREAMKRVRKERAERVEQEKQFSKKEKNED